MELQDFLDKVDAPRVVSAIHAAEATTRAEIRVHVSHRAITDPEAEAVLQFERLGMTATRERNGVLLYVAPQTQRFAVIGDTGVHAAGGEALWPEVAVLLAGHFGEGRFTDGLVAAVERLGALLAERFPRRPGEADTNELPDQISEDR
jgi:uncharacterized membrane protein